MRHFPVVLLTLALSAAATSAGADSPAVGAQTNWFKTHDRDGDGYITYDEVMSYELKLFKRADKNGDGKLSLREFIAGIPQDQPDVIQRYYRRFAAMDANHDGFVTPDEMAKFYRFLLTTSDTNGDGYVSLQEWLGATEGE
jgi:Ca2+-binding EF-hand superfamily protein